MKYKYVLINGFAFSEEKDMENLSRYAKQGYILESIKGGVFFKLRKDKPCDLIYTLDYQDEINDEYLEFFKEAGWNLVLTIRGKVNIFSAKSGTKKIYSDKDTYIDKYENAKKTSKVGTIFTGILFIISMLFMFFTIKSGVAFFINSFVSILFLIGFIFNVLPFMMFSSKIKGLKDGIETNNEKSYYKSMLGILGFDTIIFLYVGLKNGMNTIFSYVSIAIGIIFLILFVSTCVKTIKSK